MINFTLTKKLSFPKEHICDINKNLKPAILQFPNDVASKKMLRKEDEKYPLTIHANNNTMKSEIKCVYRVNFTKLNLNLTIFTVGILIESPAGVTTVARIRRIDMYHQLKYHSH